MRGLWKENLGGWNKKDSKRKKQTRRQTIRDTGRIVLKIFNGRNATKQDPDIFFVDNDRILVYKKNQKKIITKTDLYRLTVSYSKSRFNKENSLQYIVFYGYINPNESIFSKDRIIEYTTGLNAKDFIKLKHGIDVFINNFSTDSTNQTVLINIDKYVQLRNLVIEDRFHPLYKEELFLYGTKIERYMIDTLYNDGKRRKIAQKIVNSTDRAIIRDWLIKSDWDANIRTHCGSKTIAWMID
jgi:hypothetical protein